MTHHILTLRAGQTGRLRVTVTAPTGADTTLAGAVCVSGVHRPMQVSGSDLLIGTMPPGMWLYEVRCGGVTVIYGHIEVAPSPLADASGEVGWQIDADLAADVASVTVTLAEGLPGRNGAPGRDGRDGVDGRDGTDGATPVIGASGTWVIGGVDTGRPSVEVIDPVLGTCYEQAANWDAVIHWAEIDGSLVSPGQVAMIEIPCRSNGSSPLTDAPVWMTIYEADGSGGWTHLATSDNAVIQRVGTMSRWRYTGVPLTGGRDIRLCPVISPDARWDATLALGSGGRPRGAEPGGHVILSTGERSAVRLAATLRTIDGVAAHGVPIVTRDIMEAYVAEYVASHAVTDLSDYRGPIHLRDEAGNEVLRIGTSEPYQRPCVYIGDERVMIELGDDTHVVISGAVDVPNYEIHAYGYLSDNYYLFAGGLQATDSGGSPGLRYDAAYHEMQLVHDDALRIRNIGASHVSISMSDTGIIVSGPRVIVGDAYQAQARIDIDNYSLAVYGDYMMLHTADGTAYPAGTMAHNGSYIVISQPDPAP